MENNKTETIAYEKEYWFSSQVFEEALGYF